MRTFILPILVLAAAEVRADQAACMPGELQTDSTTTCISIEWHLSGDTNHNAACSVQFREQGDASWQSALPLLRVDYQWWYATEKAERPINMLAGSILFLQPGKTYEVRLQLTDPDGGNESKTVAVQTRPEPALPQGGRSWHVVPGAGGGSGTASDPFQGLASAQQAAQPGDVLLLHQGDYGSFVFEKSGKPQRHIVWKAAGDGAPLFNAVRVAASHLWFEGLSFQREQEPNGLRAGDRVTDIVIRRNQFHGFHYSITLRPDSRYWHITDNVIVGDNDPSRSDLSGEGVELNHSSGHVVAYNRISRTADGVSYPERNCDIYGNDIFDVSDDSLEPDYGFANVRMWGNRLWNYYNHALSFQPMKCGPWYFLRNQVVGGGMTFKFRVQDRFVLVNNTFVNEGSIGNRMHHILSSFSRNNLYISLSGRQPVWAAYDCNEPQYCLPNNYRPTWMTDVDHDGFDWGAAQTAFRWQNSRMFSDLAGFSEAFGIERHAVRVKKEEIFENAPAPGPIHLTLKAGSNAIDAGVVVPNLCDSFTGKSPDLGAYELGGPLPHYGPRE
jgi:hypothetical protein